MSLSNVIVELTRELKSAELYVARLRAAVQLLQSVPELNVDAILESAGASTGRAPKAQPNAPVKAAAPKATTRVPVPVSAKLRKPAPPTMIGRRDQAVLDALAKGPKPRQEILPAMPVEDGQNRDQRADALTNALTRLRIKKQIRQNQSGNWELVK